MRGNVNPLQFLYWAKKQNISTCVKQQIEAPRLYTFNTLSKSIWPCSSSMPISSSAQCSWVSLRVQICLIIWSSLLKIRRCLIQRYQKYLYRHWLCIFPCSSPISGTQLSLATQGLFSIAILKWDMSDEKKNQIRNSKFKAHQSLGLAHQGHQASPHPCPWLSKTQTRSAKELRRSHRSSSVCSRTLQRMFCWTFLDFLYFYFNRLVGPDRKIQSKIQSTCSSRNKV